MIQLNRKVLQNMEQCSHAGLLLSRGLPYYPENNEAGKMKKQLIDQICNLEADAVYKQAFTRWTIATSSSQFSTMEATLSGRLYIGATRDNPLEAGVTVHHIYGMPIISGSSIKGLCRSYATSIKFDFDLCKWLFGSSSEENDNPEESEGGGVQFHDALWVPQDKQRPFVAEIITTHHSEYYSSEGRQAATDFDSPIPASQIAINGKFYFAIEGNSEGTTLAVAILQKALENWGIGGKRSSGYGVFKKYIVSNAKEKVEVEKKRLQKEEADRQAAEVIRLRSEMLESASPIQREMLAQGYDNAKFENCINSWIDRMKTGGDDAKEIAGLLEKWWIDYKKDEWDKGGKSDKSKKKIKAIKGVLVG